MHQLTVQQALDLAAKNLQAGRVRDAEGIYLQILDQWPDDPRAMRGIGVIAIQEGRYEAAAELIRRAIALDPNFAQAYGNLGNALQGLGRIDEAIAAQRAAIAIKPDYAEAYNNLGNGLKDQWRFEQAVAAYRQAAALRPGFAQAHFNLGAALHDMLQLDEAVAAYRQAIVLNPNFPEAYNNLGNALKDSGRLDEATGAYRQAIALRPDFVEAHSNLVFGIHLHPAFGADAIAEEEQRWDRQHSQPLRNFIEPHFNLRDPHRPLRVGYVSPDFCNHSVGRCLLPVLRAHNRQQFHITCYAQVHRPDEITKEFQQHSSEWRSIVGVSDEQVARHVRHDKIDILIDLAVHTANNRLLVFARKPAPVQVTYLGYCGSTGMSAMDYRLSDPHLDPPEADLSCYTERTIRLPRSYWCYQPEAQTGEPSPSPARGNGFVTFGCLNNFAKVSTPALDLWAKILETVPSSRMIIHSVPGQHRNRILEQFEFGGVRRDRVFFVGKQRWTGYTQTYGQIDIALDPFPYGGGVTTCDSLWMGVPVVTLSGQTAVGRGGRSILSNLGLSELIAFRPDQYAEIAIELAQDAQRLIGLRQGLRARMLGSPLMDADRFSRDIEACYRQMWHNWCDEARGEMQGTKYESNQSPPISSGGMP